MQHVLIVINCGIITWIVVKVITFFLSRKEKMQLEIQWKNGLIKSLLELRKTNPIAENLVHELELDKFDFIESDINRRKDLRSYYKKVSSKVGQMLGFSTILSLIISHKFISADEVIELRRDGCSLKLVWKTIYKGCTNKIPKDFVYDEYWECVDVCQ